MFAEGKEAVKREFLWTSAARISKQQHSQPERGNTTLTETRADG